MVADADGDGSWRLGEKYGARCVNLAEQGGPARARNAGARVARGEILFFVDADVTIPSDCIVKVAAAFAAEPGLAALIGSYDRAPADAGFLSQFKNLFHHFVHQQGAAEASTFWGACGAIRRDVFLDVGGFDARYARPSIEDIELGYRLKAASYRIRLAHDIQVTHWKRWDAFTLLKTDVFDRAAPWTELILEEVVRRKVVPPGDLNLGVVYRLSLLTSFLLLVTLVAGAIDARWWIGSAFLALAFVALQLPLLRFFRAQRGAWFCVQSVVWRFGYDLYSAIGFLYGSTRFAGRHSARLLSHAFARLDPVALGTGTGVATGLALAGATAVLALGGETPLREFFGLLAQYLPGYRVSATGTWIAFVYGFGGGFAYGWATAWLCNALTRLCLGFLRVKNWIARFAAVQRSTG